MYVLSDIDKIKIYFSFIGIIYVWILPYLSIIGFAEKNSTSISQFIANSQATGAMAAVSILPIIIMNQYQYIYIKNDKEKLEKTLLFFEISYGFFLSCPINYVPKLIHQLSVICFGISFLLHSYIILLHFEYNKITKILLGLGNLCFIILVIIKSNSLIYWFLECISFTCMLLITPIDWYLLSKQKFNSNESILIL